MSTTLRAQFSHRLVADGAKWNLLFPRGMWHGVNLAPIGGSIDLDSGLLDEMVANWESAGKPKLPVRVTHRHLDDDVPAADRPALEKAVGFLTDLRVTAQGLEALTEWNAAGRKLVEGEEFAFWSPEWQPKHRDRRTGEVKGWWLSGTALTNDPFFIEMPPVAAATTPTDPPAAKEDPMNEAQLNQLRAALGLSPTATVDDCLKAASKVGTDVSTLTAEVAKLKSSPTLTAADLKKGIDDAVAPLQAKLQAAEKRALDVEVDAAADKAKRNDGKLGRAIVASHIELAKKLAASEGIKAATDFLESIPPSVPLQGTGTPVQGGEPGKMTAQAAQAELDTLVAAKMKTGLSFRDATRAANKERKDLAEIAFTVPTTHAATAEN